MMCTCTKKTTPHKNHHHTSLMREPQSLIPAVKTAQPKKKQQRRSATASSREKTHACLGGPFRESKKHCATFAKPSHQKKRVQCRLGLALFLSRVLMPGRSTAMAPSVPQASTAELNDSRNSRKRPR